MIGNYGFLGFVWREWGGAHDTALTLLVYLHAFLMIMAGGLIMAGARVGGLLLSLSMILLIITRDNPYLTHSDLQWRMTFSNMLKDLAVAGAGVLLFIKKVHIRHRKHLK